MKPKNEIFHKHIIIYIDTTNFTGCAGKKEIKIENEDSNVEVIQKK